MSTEGSVCLLVVCGRFVDVLKAEDTVMSRPLVVPKSNVLVYFRVMVSIQIWLTSLGAAEVNIVGIIS